MVDDFLKAWLIEGDIVAAMGYISDVRTPASRRIATMRRRSIVAWRRFN
jgi:hypothetical protein